MKVYLNLYVALTAVSMFAACSGQKETERQEKIIPVKIMEIEATTAANGQNYVGTVEESVAVSLSFSLTGTVEQVFVSEGQKVSKGQLLATLNTATAENSYRAALARQQQAQDACDRLTKVHANGSLPDIKIVEVEADLQQAKSVAAVSKKNLDDCRMYAPREGVIAARNIEAGSSVNPLAAAFKLVAVDKVFVKIPVPENEIGGIETGQPANVTVAALDNAVFTGKIEMKGVCASAVSHTYEAKIGIDNPQKKLLPGMVCKVETWRAASLQPAIVVPNRAVQVAADGKQYVWLSENSLAKRRRITVGNLADNGIIVVEGLSAGDRVIVEGFQKISEGTKIKVE
ncbi:MAG: efflux RND transporter periplasmic adaptor subunit [Prevotellaceae bacterium]|jgi:RND family efflux transporter MFP subunit|nr:efflux RND transporter periplasmic adaptor subunit [Prevotellaceae bacterium]